MEPASKKIAPIEVLIKHEPFTPWVELHWDGQSEELEHADALTWLSSKGARDMKAANDAICHALNFGQSAFTILNPIEIVPPRLSDQPLV